MGRNGFGLIEILIVVAIVAILGSGLYLKNLEGRQSAVQTGLDAEQQARQAVQQANQRSGQDQNLLDQFGGASSTPVAASSTSATIERPEY